MLGCDNAHGFSHKHCMGEMTREPFPGYEALFDRFDAEWREIAVEFVNGSKK